MLAFQASEAFWHSTLLARSPGLALCARLRTAQSQPVRANVSFDLGLSGQNRPSSRGADMDAMLASLMHRFLELLHRIYGLKSCLNVNDLSENPVQLAGRLNLTRRSCKGLGCCQAGKTGFWAFTGIHNFQSCMH